MFNTTLSAILRGSWLIDQQFADAHLPVVLGILQGKLSGKEFFTGSGGFEMPFVIDATGNRIDAYVYFRGSLLFNKEAITPGSVAVIPMIGPVTKYNGDCGEPGMVKRQSWASDLIGLDNVVGLITYIDSPGGQADGTPQFASFIKSIEKPTIAVVNGGAYSAGAWVASAHDKIYLDNEFSGFGSIGAYTTIVDYRGYFEKQGYKIREVYPDESKDKNRSYREARDGNITLVKEKIADLARLFISSFAENRGGKLTSNEWDTGKIFSGQKVIEIGLADGIVTFMDAVKEIQAGTTLSTPKPVHSKNSTNMKFANVVALCGIAAPTAEQIDLANADLTSEGITGATIVAESFISEAASVTAENTRLTGELETANASLATANSELETANQSNATLQNRVTELEGRLSKIAGGKHNRAAGETTDTAPDGDDSQAVLDSLPHNKYADKLLG